MVFISQGTTALNDRPDFFRMCLGAFAATHWQELGQIPDTVEIRAFFPQLDIPD